ncbi:MAG: flagellar hook-basal body complex protein FliE [Hoeflea sp.]|uniref:flagellar hook-basal body complex protein FliE n=1 Tax=Hoeflea sp. TaxID=1940281 RepID=UPI00272FA8A2|nr:flagellar hook-basal body complex protein FliE [Hoeflea sp.]MDP2119394.1 flagellar hook-basal body complex protein FliE [Hoeflea sp.]MDZ7600150.1 flagellar hook-basal body complex protein FliE [Hoeflea sp.]
MIDMIGAASALSRLSGSGGTDIASAASMAQAAGTAASAMPGGSFADVMQSMGESVVDNLKVAEGQSFAAVRGEAATRDVVDAIMTAEQSLQTAVAIRDKLVTAYLEIARMQI